MGELQRAVRLHALVQGLQDPEDDFEKIKGIMDSRLRDCAAIMKNVIPNECEES